MGDENCSVSQIQQEIEDANELLYYIQDLYQTITYELYREMLTSSLMQIFFTPVVVQSLTVFKIKPKLGIQICLYVLTMTLQVIKCPLLQNQLVSLLLGSKLSRQNSELLNQPVLFQSQLYSDKFTNTNHNKLLQIYCAYAQSSKSFETYLVKASPEWLKKEIKQANSSNNSEHFYNLLSETDKVKLEGEQTYTNNVLGIRGMYS